jgi:hypothetical protein
MRLAPLAGLLLLPVLAVAIVRIPHSQGVSGIVTAGAGPVGGATVHVQGQPFPCAATDKSGRFFLEVEPKPGARLTAAKSGFFIGGCLMEARALHIALEPLPASDHETYAWVPAKSQTADDQACAGCHRAIHEEWFESGHARAANGRRFLSLYGDLLKDLPDGAGVCSSCHAPTIAFDNPAFYDLREASGVAAEGVHCDYCHKIKEAATSKVGLTHGRFALQLLRPSRGQLFFGPLDDAHRGNDVYLPLYGESSYCAPCHEGTVFGVHVYGTYSEWLESPARRAGKSCQSCHMAPSGRLSNIAPGAGGVERDPATLANHRFFAGSQAEMLRAALRVSVACKPHSAAMSVSITVTAQGAGHRVPTGFPDHNLILLVEGFAADGRSLSPNGGASQLPDLLAQPEIGLPGKLYAKQLRGWDNERPVPFWRATPNFVDSRLHPEEPDRSEYSFPRDLRRLRIRLVYRRFWEAVRRAKSWPADEITVLDHTIEIQGNAPSTWSDR